MCLAAGRSVASPTERSDTVARVFRRPKSRRGAVIAICTSFATFVIVAFAVVYFVLFPTSSPKRFSLSSPTAAGTTSTTGATTRASSGSGLTGNWKVTSGSQAGYRVREKLGFLPAQSDAVGRTSQITGAATFSETKGTVTISAASFNVAVDTLKSDRSMRDEKIHEIGLESSRYPTATFALSTPLTVTASALEGKVAHLSVTGAFDIHGTTKTETVPVELSLSGSTLEAVGSLTSPWSEFGMSAPSVGGFVNVTGKATMEFDLRLQRA
jgi:polyisoprenoid-binding protein YceI